MCADQYTIACFRCIFLFYNISVAHSLYIHVFVRCIGITMASSSAKIDYNKVFLSKHPVLQHKLTLLRDVRKSPPFVFCVHVVICRYMCLWPLQKSTNSNTFRLLLNELTFYLGYEATRDCTVAKRDFEVRIGD